MRRFYLVLAVLIILLGLVHLLATFLLFDAFSSRALWFAGAGLAIVMTGILNLLDRAYGALAKGVRWAAIGANLVMTLFAALAGFVGAASGLQLILIVGLLAATSLISLARPRLSA